MDQRSESKEDNTLVISGELVNASVCANNWSIDELELPKLAEQVKNVTLRVDHSKSAWDVIGGFRLGKFDPQKKSVNFEAEVDDPSIQRSIMKGRLKYVSIGATADAYCSKCNKSTRPLRACSCKGSHDIIRNIKLKEASIVTDPAFIDSKFEPVSFAASINSALAENLVTADASKEAEARLLVSKKMEDKKMSEKTENVSATTLKPAGADAVVLLGTKLEQLAAAISKMEERWKKQDEDEFKKKEIEDEKKKSEDEAKKKDDFANIIKTEFANITSKLEGLVKTKDECKKEDKATFSNVPASGGIPKDVKHEGKKEPPNGKEPEEPEEKEVKKEIVKGSRVETASATQAEFTADAIPPWFNEIKAFAQKHSILDS